MSENLDEYRWLVSDEARPWLEKAAATEDDPTSLLATTIVLRRDLGASRTHLVIAQAQLRRRARTKFSQARRMFFTRQLLAQATDEQLARYKALRFPIDEPVADLCCGIGGDLIGLADRCQTLGVDRDEVAALLAQTNCAALGLEGTSICTRDVVSVGLDNFAAWHLDPDRRPQRQRTTDLELHDPDLSVMQQLLERHPAGAIKLAPATVVPESWQEQAELEWIGNRGECRQQIAWFGPLARHPGQRAATVFTNGTPSSHSITGDVGAEVPATEKVGRYVFEPHSAVLAADLAGVVAERHALIAITPDIPYFTGDAAVRAPELSCYEVLEALPFNLRRLRPLLRQRRIGRLEIKKRGVRLTPEQVRSELSLRGDQAATLLLMPLRKKVLAVLCRRVDSCAVESPV